MLNPRLDGLNDYFFKRLAQLLAPVAPAAAHEPIDLSIGQPMHPVPRLLTETLQAEAQLWGRYPPVLGTAEFRAAAASWLRQRYRLPDGWLDPERHVLPVAGTKEALYLIAQAVTPPASAGRPPPVILMPNPFYNVYLGAAVMAGAEPVLLTASDASGQLPDLDQLTPELLERTAAFYLCSPANPQGVAADEAYFTRALQLARSFGFLLVVDECYAEIYTRTAPTGALRAAAGLGQGPANLVVCHSLSKRSNAAGLRSGFVAGDADFMASFARLRSYAAAVQPLPVMAAATALWRDEEHVQANRALYRAKFDLADSCLGGRFGYRRPAGGFFLWLDVGDGEQAARALWAEAALKVVPGAYLGRADASGRNPGAHAIRVAMVHDLVTTEQALARLVKVLG